MPWTHTSQLTQAIATVFMEASGGTGPKVGHSERSDLQQAGEEMLRAGLRFVDETTKSQVADAERRKESGLEFGKAMGESVYAPFISSDDVSKGLCILHKGTVHAAGCVTLCST